MVDCLSANPPYKSDPPYRVVVVVHKHQKAGDKVFCRVCGNGFAMEKQQSKLALKPTMQKGNAADLQALIDHDLLARLLDESLPYLPVDSGNGKSWLRRLRNGLWTRLD